MAAVCCVHDAGSVADPGGPSGEKTVHSGDTVTISATFTVTLHPARSPCVADEARSILTTSVAVILKIADAEHLFIAVHAPPA